MKLGLRTVEGALDCRGMRKSGLSNSANRFGLPGLQALGARG